MNSPSLTAYCLIRKGKVITAARQLEFAPDGKFFREVFKSLNSGYAKYYKMDRLSKLAYLASEFLLEGNIHRKYAPEEIAMVFSNASSSIDSDIRHQASIADRSKYFPEPATFVYTLPNIMLGEISIRYDLKGENMFFISEEFDPAMIAEYTSVLLDGTRHKACISGWVEYNSNDFMAAVFFAESIARNEHLMEFSAANLQKIMEF